MKTIKSKLIALLAVFIFFACASTKKTSEITVKNDVKTEASVSKQTDIATGTQVVTDQNRKENKQAETKTQVNNHEQSSTNTIKYDTGKPIVPGTGRPPVMEETITNRQLTGTIQQQVKEIYSLQEENKMLLSKFNQMKSKVDSLVTVTDKSKMAVNQEEEKTKPSGWVTTIMLIIVLSTICIALYQCRGIFIRIFKRFFSL